MLIIIKTIKLNIVYFILLYFAHNNIYVHFHRSMLYNGSDVVRDLEWVIFDEVHYVNDSEVLCITVIHGLPSSCM